MFLVVYDDNPIFCTENLYLAEKFAEECFKEIKKSSDEFTEYKIHKDTKSFPFIYKAIAIDKNTKCKNISPKLYIYPIPEIFEETDTESFKSKILAKNNRSLLENLK